MRVSPLLRMTLAAAVLLAVGGCDWVQKKAPPNEKRLAAIARARDRLLHRACASTMAFERLSKLTFDEAIRVRNADPRNLATLAAHTIVRMEHPLVRRRDDRLDVTVCSGRFILELPPGAERGFGGERRLVADVEYAAQPAADGDGLVYQLRGAEPIVYKLAAFDLKAEPYRPGSADDPTRFAWVPDDNAPKRGASTSGHRAAVEAPLLAESQNPGREARLAVADLRPVVPVKPAKTGIATPSGLRTASVNPRPPALAGRAKQDARPDLLNAPAPRRADAGSKAGAKTARQSGEAKQSGVRQVRTDRKQMDKRTAVARAETGKSAPKGSIREAKAVENRRAKSPIKAIARQAKAEPRKKAVLREAKASQVKGLRSAKGRKDDREDRIALRQAKAESRAKPSPSRQAKSALRKKVRILQAKSEPIPKPARSRLAKAEPRNRAHDLKASKTRREQSKPTARNQVRQVKADTQTSPKSSSASRLASIRQALADAEPVKRAASAPKKQERVQQAAAPQKLPAQRAVMTQTAARPAMAVVRFRPSFNCSLARSRSEQMICSSRQLAALDRSAASLFSSAVSDADAWARAELARTRNRFLAFRERCTSETCVANAYRGRMEEIRDIMAQAN